MSTGIAGVVIALVLLAAWMYNKYQKSGDVAASQNSVANYSRSVDITNF